MQPNFHLTGGLDPHGTPGQSPAENSSPLTADEHATVTASVPSEAPTQATAAAGAGEPTVTASDATASAPIAGAETGADTGAASAPAVAPITSEAAASLPATEPAPIPAETAPAPSPEESSRIVPHALSAQQAKVLAGLSAGRNIASAAAGAGVSRSTVYRWNSDPDFVAALNAWKRQTRESAQHRLLAMGDQAVTIVQDALDDNDARIAMALLRELGILRKVAVGSSDRDEVRAKSELRKYQKDVVRRKRFIESFKEEREVKNYADMFRVSYPWKEPRPKGK